MSIYNGVENLGLENALEAEVFHVQDNNADDSKEGEAINYAVNLYTKSFECPVCYETFESTVVRHSKLRYVSSDIDLRAIYKPMDPAYYSILLCPHCGYAALTDIFNRISDKQTDKIKEQITPKFKKQEYPLVLSAEHAIKRHKIALLNAVVKGVRDSEKGYLCIKIAWIYRDLKDDENEMLFIDAAYKFLVEALSKEYPPIFGMDESTLMYLLGALARKLGHNKEALRLMSNVILKTGTSDRLKDRARDLREMIKAEESEAAADNE